MISKRWIIFGICASLFLMSQFYRASGAIIAPDLMSDLKLSHHGLGLWAPPSFIPFSKKGLFPWGCGDWTPAIFLLGKSPSLEICRHYGYNQ